MLSVNDIHTIGHGRAQELSGDMTENGEIAKGIIRLDRLEFRGYAIKNNYLMWCIFKCPNDFLPTLKTRDETLLSYMMDIDTYPERIAKKYLVDSRLVHRKQISVLQSQMSESELAYQTQWFDSKINSIYTTDNQFKIELRYMSRYCFARFLPTEQACFELAEAMKALPSDNFNPIDDNGFHFQMYYPRYV